MKYHTKDFYGRAVSIPRIGDRVLRDGFEYVVSDVRPHRNIAILAAITLKGPGGEVEIGYYDYLNHKSIN